MRRSALKCGPEPLPRGENGRTRRPRSMRHAAAALPNLYGGRPAHAKPHESQGMRMRPVRGPCRLYSITTLDCHPQQPPEAGLRGKGPSLPREIAERTCHRPGIPHMSLGSRRPSRIHAHRPRQGRLHEDGPSVLRSHHISRWQNHGRRRSNSNRSSSRALRPRKLSSWPTRYSIRWTTPPRLPKDRKSVV